MVVFYKACHDGGWIVFFEYIIPDFADWVGEGDVSDCYWIVPGTFLATPG